MRLACTCGTVAGSVRNITPRNSWRLSCMCDDCQLYAHCLGRTSAILDRHGGTELSYTTQCRIALTAGQDQLRAVRLYRTGILRVYADCCRTPIAHIPSPHFAFVALVHTCMHTEAGESRDMTLGPLVHRLQARYCRGEMPDGAHPGTPVSLSARAMLSVLQDTWRREHRPSPFHEPTSATPTMPTRVLTPLELQALRAELPTRRATTPTARVRPAGCS